METEGLVKRIQCKEDKRGHMLEPTAKGFALRKAMWAVYATLGCRLNSYESEVMRGHAWWRASATR
jgi:DNA-binding MarR family transcriptional regulator